MARRPAADGGGRRDVVPARRRQVTDSRARMAELELPTLVVHSRGDRMQEFQRGRELAAGIRGARLVALESNNHIVLEEEPAWPVFLREVSDFLGPDRGPPTAVTEDLTSVLSPRELDILRLPLQGTTTTPSPSNSSSRCAQSSATCRTPTPSSGCTAATPVPQPWRDCSPEAETATRQPPPRPRRGRSCASAPMCGVPENSYGDGHTTDDSDHTRSTITDTPEDQALKAKHAAMWASGSYPTVADEVVDPWAASSSRPSACSAANASWTSRQAPGPRRSPPPGAAPWYGHGPDA